MKWGAARGTPADLTPAQPDIICPLCGTHYTEAEGRACHLDCPLHEHCGRLSCPYCAHEVPAPTALTRWLSRWTGKGCLAKGPEH
jgi:uncharacterized Zn-finger protein